MREEEIKRDDLNVDPSVAQALRDYVLVPLFR
jgi:hypothetical protein